MDNPPHRPVDLGIFVTMPAPPLPITVRMAPHRSLLHIGPHARLLGLDPESALAVDDLPPGLAQMLDELAAPSDVRLLVDRAVRRGADPEQAETLLRELLDAGAVVDADAHARPGRHRAASTVVVVGDGPLGVGIGAGLALGGVGAVYVEAAGTVLAADVGTGCLDADRGRERAEAARDAIRRLVPAARPGPPPRRVRPDLVVLTDAAAPDPVRVSALLTAGTTHLCVRLRDGTGVVGPLVLPGRSACLGCLELHRCARDPCWPTVTAQLVSRSGNAEPACAAATVALGTAQALAALDGAATGGPVPPVLDATLELDPTAATLVRKRWAAHAACSCGAAAVLRPGPQDATCGAPTSRGRITW